MNPPAQPIKQPRDIALGERIREVRRAKKLTQDQLAFELGISLQQFIKYETAENRISWSRLTEIADAMDIDWIDLIMPLVPSRKNVKGSKRA